MSSTPWLEIYPNMTCHPAKDKQQTLYVDSQSAEYETCFDTGVCTAHRGTWYSLYSFVVFLGKITNKIRRCILQKSNGHKMPDLLLTIVGRPTT